MRTLGLLCRFSNYGTRMCDPSTADWFSSSVFPFTASQSAPNTYSIIGQTNVFPNVVLPVTSGAADFFATHCTGATFTQGQWTVLPVPLTNCSVLKYAEDTTFKAKIINYGSMVSVEDLTSNNPPGFPSTVNFDMMFYSPTVGFWVQQDCTMYSPQFNGQTLYMKTLIGLDGSFYSSAELVNEFFTDDQCSQPFFTTTFYGTAGYVGTSPDGSYSFIFNVVSTFIRRIAK